MQIKSQIAKARASFANLKHLWPRHDTRLSPKGRVYSVAVRGVLVVENSIFRVEDVRRSSVFRFIASVWSNKQW